MNKLNKLELLSTQLLDIFGQVRKALREGKLDDLKPLVRTQTDLTRRFEKEITLKQPTEIQLRKIASSAQRNQRLLDAALQGVRSASRRNSDIRDAGHLGRVYDRNGRQNQMAEHPVGQEKRS